MENQQVANWLRWARRLQALSQTGLHFVKDPFDEERYRELGAIAVEILHSQTDFDKKDMQESFTFQQGYATPKVAVRGAVFRGQKILLVKEASDGFWNMPGGWADVNESPSEMVEREVWEESGFHVRAKRLIGIYDTNHQDHPVEFWHTYKLIFQCEILDGHTHPSLETTAVDFFHRDQLPSLSRLRTTTREIEESYEHLSDPTRLTYFD